MRERDIFIEALQRESCAEREAYLASTCAEDAELRRRVEKLLADHQNQETFFLDKPAPGVSVALDQPIAERPGMQIGPYKLLQQIGEGGFGVVFMAEQLEPVRRKVALKVIKPGMDTRQIIARFEAERQALAVMDHPNIARVLEAGATASGRPYFVMELVRGVPITAYCDENNLPIRERLELFAAVCQAIQHAHTKGIIHRDIKPSNVLVSRQDGRPVVKVIDFGIAKAMGQQLTEKTLFTDFAQMIGTPLYMSPEQAELSSLDIDTRSDIYSLGVLLYELLTGSTPVDKEALMQAAFDEIRRIIREDEPPKPSLRISGSRTLPSIAAQRHIEPGRLSKIIRGELDWIVMKALEKDRNRRYETANGFAADVNRYLSDEAVQACPPSAAYRLRKLVRRNKAALAMAGVIFSALLLATIGLAVSNVFIRTERNEKVNALGAKERALGEKQAALAEAKTNAENATRQQRLAQEQEGLARRRFYTAQLNLAMQAWDEGDAARTLELLEGQRPALGQQDVRGFEWYHLWGRCHRGLRARLDHGPGVVQTVAFFPDGKRLASLVGGLSFKVWKLESAQEEKNWATYADSFALAPDGKTIASWAQYEPVRLWDVSTGQQAAVFEGTTFCSFASDGKSIALVRKADVEFWDVAARERRSILHKGGHGEVAYGSFIFSPDGKTAAVSVPKPGHMRLCRWNGARWDEAEVLPQHGWHLPAAFSPDGATLAVGGDRLALYAADTGKRLEMLEGHSGIVYGVAFSPDGKSLASASNDRTVRTWDLATYQQRHTFAHPASVVSVAYSPDGKMLASGGSYETLRLWEAEPPEEVVSIKLSRIARALAFSPNSGMLAAAGNGITSLIDVSNERVDEILDCHANSLAFSRDGRFLAAGREDHSVELWKMPDVKASTILEGHSDRVLCVAFSSDDKSLASSSYDGTVRVWDLATRTTRLTLHPNRPTAAVAFSPDGRTLATGGLSENVRLWDATTGRELLAFQVVDREGKGPWCWSLAFSPDGKTLAAASQSGHVRLWDTSTARLSGLLRGHTGGVRCVAFSSDGGTLATAAEDRTIRLWDMRTRQEKLTFKSHEKTVRAVAFSPDGNTLAGVSDEGSLRLWKTSREPAAEALRTDLDPDDPISPAALIDVASRLMAAGRLEEAHRAYKDAQARVLQLVAAFPAVSEYRFLQRECELRASQVLMQIGGSDGSDKAYQTSIVVLERLAAEFPEERRRIARDCTNVGRTALGNAHVERPETALRQAVHLYRPLVAESPQDAALRSELAGALAYLGVALESRGRSAEAEEPYRQATLAYQTLSEEAPENEWYRQELAYFNAALASVVHRTGRPDAAVEHCRTNVRLNEQLVTDFPNVAVHVERLASGRGALMSLLSSLGRDQEAAKEQRQQEKFDQIQAALREQSKVVQAMTSSPDPVKPKSRSSANHAERGWLLLRRQQFLEAEAVFRELIEQQPDHAMLHRGLGSALRGQKKFAEAIAPLREAVRLGPTDFWAHENLGWMLRAQQQPAEAEAEFREAIRLQPTLVSAHFGLSQTLRDQKKLSEQIVPLREVIRLDPTYIQAREALAWALLDQQQLAEAEAVFRELLRLAPESESGLRGLGRALVQQERFADAIAPLREALRRDATYPWAHDGLGWALLHERQTADAEAAFRELIRLQPEAAASHYGLGCALLEQKKYTEAETALREAVRLDPTHRRAHQALGEALAGQGQLLETENRLKRESSPKPQDAEQNAKPE